MLVLMLRQSQRHSYTFCPDSSTTPVKTTRGFRMMVLRRDGVSAGLSDSAVNRTEFLDGVLGGDKSLSLWLLA